MKIVLNSDVIFANSLIKDSLPRKLYDFVAECKKHNHTVVIPLTTLFEFDNKQGEFLATEKNKINKAVQDLKSYKIEVADFCVNEILKPPDLIHLIQNTGIACVLEEPTKDDYDMAHRKACFHHSPHPPDIKSDEMRDLIIWEIAIRTAKGENGAILVSRDPLHIHHRGDQESLEVNLLRFNSFERAMEALDIETPSAKEIKQLLDKVWDRLIASNLPLQDGASLVSVKRPRFRNNENGIVNVNALLKFHTGDGKELSTTMNMDYIFDSPKSMTFTQILIDNSNSMNPITIKLSEIEIPDYDYKKRLKDLKELF